MQSKYSLGKLFNTNLPNNECLFYIGKKLYLPIGQPIYLNHKNGQVTWRALSNPIGYTVSKDSGGYYKVKLV
jgi:hypothetical protein